MPKNSLRVYVAVAFALAIACVATDERLQAAVYDRWIHPRGESFDPVLHYRDAGTGEPYYHAENAISQGLGNIVVTSGARPQLTSDLGEDLWAFVERNGGVLRPVLLYDSDGDGVVDRTLRGRIQGKDAVFDAPEFSVIDLRQGVWQLGIIYGTGVGGDPAYDGRYLASVTSSSARVAFASGSGLPSVGAGPVAGLVIMEHGHGTAFDFATFTRDPKPFAAGFDALTPVEDDDDWTVEEDGEGTLRTHFEQENLFLVHTVEGLTLDILWGDMPLVDFLDERLSVEPNSRGCYSSLDSQLVGSDGVHQPLPHRLLYCPQDSLAMFDAPPGYQIFLSAKRGDEVLATTEASTSILDNVRLYAHEVYPRSPYQRATGTVWGNVRAGFADAGQDLVDVARHAVIGTYRTNVHTGQKHYRPSPLTAVPLALWDLVRLKPVNALGKVVVGAFSAVRVAADVVSATNNGVVNPLLQSTIGAAGSTGAADSAGHWFGALTQAAAKNLPFSERSADALNPVSLWYHNRAFVPSEYTRTDTQLNIDRVLTIANIFATYAVIDHIDDSGGSDSGGSGGDPGGPPDGGEACASRGAPNGATSNTNRSANAVAVLGSIFCKHPTFKGLLFGLPVRF